MYSKLYLGMEFVHFMNNFLIQLMTAETYLCRFVLVFHILVDRHALFGRFCVWHFSFNHIGMDIPALSWEKVHVTSTCVILSAKWRVHCGSAAGTAGCALSTCYTALVF